MAFLCGLRPKKDRRSSSRLSTLMSAPEGFNEVTQFRGEAQTGDLPASIFQRPALSAAALVPFTTHRDDKCTPPPTGFGNELITWSVAMLDAKPNRTCEELEKLLTAAIRRQVPDAIAIDCTVTVTHVLTSSHVKVVDMLVPWSCSLFVKEYIRKEWSVYAEDHEALMPDNLLTTTMPTPSGAIRKLADEDEWLVLMGSSDNAVIDDLASNVTGFLEALYANAQPASTRSTSRWQPVSTTLTTEHKETNTTYSALFFFAPPSSRPLVAKFLALQVPILRLYIRPGGARLREELSKRRDRRKLRPWIETALQEREKARQV